MILDRQEYFRTVTTGLETIGGHEAGTSDYRDTHAVGAFDTSKKTYLVIEGSTDLVRGAGAANLVITLTSDSAAAFNVAKVTHHTWTIAKANVAATRTRIQLPESIKRYCRIEWDVSEASDSGGAFKAYLYSE
jgi:hypothetical protein